MSVIQQGLTHKGKRLANDQTIISYGIEKNSVIDLITAPAPNIQVFVKTADGRKIPIEVNGDDSINIVKQKIKAKEGIPVVEQALSYNGKQLVDERTVSDYRIDKNEVLELGTSRIPIVVKTQTGRKIPLEVSVSDPIIEVKQQILEKEGIPVNMQNFSFKGKYLSDDQILQNCNIEKGSVLDLVPPVQDVQIFVKYEGKKVPFIVNGVDSVRMLKQKILSKEGFVII
jgi:uncharacterized ubiquitin-like protein YukD